MKRGFLAYCPTNDRWMFRARNGSSFGLHCGDVVEIKVFQQYRSARLELAEDWYVIFSDVSFILKHTSFYEARYS